MQLNSAARLSLINIRLRYIYRPNSDFFVIYNQSTGAGLDRPSHRFQFRAVIPLPLFIEADQKQIRVLKLRQNRLAVGLPGDGIAERRCQAIEDGGLSQEVLDVFGLLLSDIPGLSSHICEQGNVLLCS